jgi:hypothetical protein
MTIPFGWIVPGNKPPLSPPFVISIYFYATTTRTKDVLYSVTPSGSTESVVRRNASTRPSMAVVFTQRFSATTGTLDKWVRISRKPPHTTRAPMLSLVFGGRTAKHQILNPIVSAVVVDVMDDLTMAKFPAELAFHQKLVLVCVSVGNHGVLFGVRLD